MEHPVVVRLVDRLPSADQVPERLGDELDVARPPLTVGSDEEAAARREPSRQREVVERHPRCDACVVGGVKHVPVVRDRALVVDPVVGLQPGPVHRQAVMGQPQLREKREVLGVAAREAVAATGHRRAPARSQSHQSDASDAPSHCVDDAPVPHMNPSGHRIV